MILYRRLLFTILISGCALNVAGKVIFKEDFQEKSPIKLWIASRKYKINFMGLTSENAPEGRKVFKLDISFLQKKKGYYYFELPCKFIPAGNLRLKSRILLGKKSTGKLGIGFNVFFKNLRRSGCKSIVQPLITTTGNKWKKLDIDSEKWLSETKAAFRKKYIPMAADDNFTPCINKIIFFCFGDAGRRRIVLYCDGIQITGNVLPVQNLKTLSRKNWNQVLLKQKKLIKKYRLIVEKYIKATGKSSYGDKCKTLLEGVEKQQSIRGNRFILKPKDYKQIKRNMIDLKSMGNAKLSDKALVYTLNNPIINTMVLPEAMAPESAKLGSEEVKVVAAKGEFESFSVLVKAMQNLDKLTLVCDDLKNRSGAVIPAANVDFKSVKCWYQSGSAWESYRQAGGRKITPELLLNDDSLVRVDDKLRTNFIKLRFADGDKYWNAEDSKWNKKVGLGILPVEQHPIRDAKKLLPLKLEANRLKQFWGTVKVPKTAAPGVYSGIVKVLNGNEIITQLVLKLRVLPFELPMPKTRYSLKEDFISSMFYRSKYSSKYPNGTISSDFRSFEQIAAELKNIREHNIYNPNCYQPFDDKDALGKVLELRNAAGMKGLPLYYIGMVTSLSWKNKIDKLIKRVKAIKDFVKNLMYLNIIVSERTKHLARNLRRSSKCGISYAKLKEKYSVQVQCATILWLIELIWRFCALNQSEPKLSCGKRKIQNLNFCHTLIHRLEPKIQ